MRSCQEQKPYALVLLSLSVLSALVVNDVFDQTDWSRVDNQIV
jgi:hypothetical protein